jgi:hypothetical protein
VKEAAKRDCKKGQMKMQRQKLEGIESNTGSESCTGHPQLLPVRPKGHLLQETTATRFVRLVPQEHNIPALPLEIFFFSLIS